MVTRPWYNSTFELQLANTYQLIDLRFNISYVDGILIAIGMCKQGVLFSHVNTLLLVNFIAN